MRKLLLINILMTITLCTYAQIDITKYYLENYGFDDNFDYTAGQTTNVAEEIKTVKGWTSTLSATYTIVGTYEFGFKGVFNTATVPETGYDGEAGGGLAFSTGWEQTFKFSQSVYLPAGTYTLRVPTYNGSNVTAATSQVAWVPSSGTAVTSTRTSYKSKSWTVDEITFTLTKRTKGNIQFGMKAASGGSANSAKLIVDYVQLLGTDLAVDKTILNSALKTANNRYNETGKEAAALKSVIDAGQAVYDNADADMQSVLDVTSALYDAIEAYNTANDMTAYITNPSFEDGLTGWTSVDMEPQTNRAFSLTDGKTFVEKWVASGTAGNASIKQTLKNLPNGNYELTVSGQNIAESTPTTSKAGAYIFAVFTTTKRTVNTAKEYTLAFTNIAGDVEIGFVADNAKGNWLSVDNFRLRFVSELDAQSTVDALQSYITTGESLLKSMMAGDISTALTSAIETAQAMTAESASEDIQNAAQQIIAAIEQARISIASYKTLTSQLSTANSTINSNMSITAYNELNTAITTGEALKENPANALEANVKAANQNLEAAIAHAKTAITEYKTVVSQLSTAIAQQGNMMSTEASTALNAAILAGQTISTTSTDEEVQNAGTALTEANALAKTSIALYKNLQTQVDAANNTYDENKNGAEALKAELDHATALVTSGNSDPDDLVAEVDILKKAIFAFNLANPEPGSGTAPAVKKTVTYVATGATQALMRATIAGSNILEQGVCWSTEHAPTVLDNRSTKSFSLKGTLFHITGLKPATVYYLRPYVINKTYTVAYGDEVKIVTMPKGTCTWSWDEAGPDEATNARCRNAIKETIDYFNEWTGIQGFHLQGHYVPGAGAGSGTADYSYGGYMRISQNTANQAIGTVLHETGHGVGVGTGERYSDTNLHDWWWKGRATNEAYQFLENELGNSEYIFKGDGTHAWGGKEDIYASYDWLVNGSSNDKHQEIQYIGGMCILRGMFIDGLDPTSSGWWYTTHNGISGYTYNFDDNKKYYLMNKDSNRGLGEGLLYHRGISSASWKPYLPGESISDEAAWYIEFDAKKGYYMFKNASSGRYLSHASSITLKNITTPTNDEQFQLMPDRTDVTIGTGKNTVTTHGYWFTWTTDGFKSMSANALSSANGYGTVVQTSFNYSDDATTQQWIIISEDELEAYQNAAIATGIHSIELDNTTPDENKTVVGIYTTGGIQLQKTTKGFNVIKYSDGSSETIYIK